MKHIRSILIALVLAASVGCAPQSPPQQVNMEDYLFQTALTECRNKTWDLMHNDRQPLRSSYFKGCMEDRGYGPETYRNLWIDVLD